MRKIPRRVRLALRKVLRLMEIGDARCLVARLDSLTPGEGDVVAYDPGELWLSEILPYRDQELICPDRLINWLYRSQDAEGELLSVTALPAGLLLEYELYGLHFQTMFHFQYDEPAPELEYIALDYIRGRLKAAVKDAESPTPETREVKMTNSLIHTPESQGKATILERRLSRWCRLMIEFQALGIPFPGQAAEQWSLEVLKQACRFVKDVWDYRNGQTQKRPEMPDELAKHLLG